MDSLTEMERKFFINTKENFEIIVDYLIKSRRNDSLNLNNYKVKEFVSKERNYRYFDTFERTLEKGDLLAYVGTLERELGSASLRERENDFVFTVKLPTDDPEVRKEYQNEISGEEIDFYALSPEDFMHWKPMRMVKERGGNRSLQEVVRLLVKTNRFDLYQNEQYKIEVAVDEVKGESPLGISSNFYELEIETKEHGTDTDKEAAALYFTEQFGKHLIQNSLPKWIKALKLMRGEKLQQVQLSDK